MNKHIKCALVDSDYVNVLTASGSIFLGLSVDDGDEEEICVMLDIETVDELIDVLIEARGKIDE